LKGVEGAEGFGEGLPHEVFGFGLITGEPVGVIVERGEEWERELLEGCAAVNRGGHDAKCLGGCEVAECGVAWSRRRDEEDRNAAWNIPFVNRIADSLFHELFADAGIKQGLVSFVR
jgi:hypothetical protein